jgi:general secretion pathway protein A
MREYIRHRIRAAGGDGTAAFLPDAMDAVFDSTLGIPRRVNALCDRALKAACLRKAKQITFDMVREAAISTGQP